MRPWSWNPKKWGYAQMIIVMAVPGLCVFVFIMADFLWVPVHDVTGIVRGETDDWSLKHGYRCYLAIDTSLGLVTDTFPSRCKHLYIPGQMVHVKVGVGRMTGQLIGGMPIGRAASKTSN